MRGRTFFKKLMFGFIFESFGICSFDERTWSVADNRTQDPVASLNSGAINKATWHHPRNGQDIPLRKLPETHRKSKDDDEKRAAKRVPRTLPTESWHC